MRSNDTDPKHMPSFGALLRRRGGEGEGRGKKEMGHHKPGIIPASAAD